MEIYIDPTEDLITNSLLRESFKINKDSWMLRFQSTQLIF